MAANPYVVLITGSRSWRRNRPVQDAIREAIREAPSGRRIVFRHGACRKGVDAIADTYLRYLGGEIEIERHPAEWRRLGKAAGPLRNKAMVDAGADLCLAFIDRCEDRQCVRPKPHGSHGATHAAGLAEEAGIPVRRYGWRGGNAHG